MFTQTKARFGFVFLVIFAVTLLVSGFFVSTKTASAFMAAITVTADGCGTMDPSGNITVTLNTTFENKPILVSISPDGDMSSNPSDFPITRAGLTAGDYTVVITQDTNKLFSNIVNVPVCAVVPETNVINITNIDELNNALKNQADGQTWNIAAGNYTLTDNATLYTAPELGGFFGVITKNNINIIGTGSPVINSNGNAGYTGTFLVMGSDVTLDGITFQPNLLSANRTVDIAGTNATVKNCRFEVDGALYIPAEFNKGSLGTLTITGNTFTNNMIAFDSAKTADSIEISNNTFNMGSSNMYAIGNVSWTAPETTTMATITMNNNIFNTNNTGKPIVRNRMTGMFNLTGNTVNGATLSDWTSLLLLQSDKFSTPTDPIVVVDGKTYSIASIAKTAADHLAADPVIGLISALPTPVTLANKDAVVAARTAYTALSVDQQALVTNLATLVADENTIASLESPQQVFTGRGSSAQILLSAAPVATNITPTVGKVLGAEKFNFTQLIKKGSKGNEVTELQKFLNTLGNNSGIADSNFGPKTRTATIKFQIANGLIGDGIVGPLTRAVLNK